MKILQELTKYQFFRRQLANLHTQKLGQKYIYYSEIDSTQKEITKPDSSPNETTKETFWDNEDSLFHECGDDWGGYIHLSKLIKLHI